MKTLTFFMIGFAMRSNVAQHLHAFPESQKTVQVSQSVTGEQVEQILVAAKGKPDPEVAKQLYSLEPSARFGSATVKRCQAYLAGPKVKEAFAALADRSVFYGPPAGEIPSLVVPDVAAQKMMLTLTTEYVAKTLHHLPNFYATRTTTTFTGSLRSDLRFHLVGKHDATVYYRDGDELLREGHWSRVKGLTTRGEFGPILLTAMLDAVKGNLRWDRWEQLPSGPAAVFAYEVTATDSHYLVDGQGSAYGGEIAIDPSSGAIRRLVLKSEMDPVLQVFYSGLSLKVADIEVDYGPVDIGGETYMCPLKGVALSEGKDLIWLNDVVFDNYHLFRGETRILSGFQTVQ